MSDGEPSDPDAWMQWRFCNRRATAGQPGTLAYGRYEFARHQASALGVDALSEAELLDLIPGRLVSLRTVLFTTADDAALVVVVGAHEPDREVEKALPYALEHVRDRDLVVIVPKGTEWPILARLAWLYQSARVFSHMDGAVSEHAIPLRADVLAAMASEPGAPQYELSPAHLGWADEVISWANGQPRLVPSHRASYLGWQVDGRLVLKVDRASGGRLRIAAGVRPGSESPKASGQAVLLDGPLADAEPLREAVRRAIADRLRGADKSHVEHRFQAHLQMLEPADRLGLETFIPEYPAQRPVPGGIGAGSIDFLGVDDGGRLHVVETKVGGSESTVFMQALDYWVWVEANRARLAEELGADPEIPAALSVVVLPSADGQVLHRHNRPIADRLHRSVPLKMWTAEIDLEGTLRLREASFGSIRSGDRWTDRMRSRAGAASRLADGRPGGSIAEPTAGTFPGSDDVVEQVTDAAALHSHVHLPHSSQRFAIDLFGSLPSQGVGGLLTLFFGPIESADSPTFEWVDEQDQLGEKTKARPNQTQVDVYLAGTTIDGRRVALLVEVKLTEVEFGTCSHAEVAPVDARTVCAQDGPFGAEPERCWQLRNRGAEHRRRYDEFLSPVPVGHVDVGAGCWFRERNQPMRLAALAGALVQSGQLDECRAVLTAPMGHVSIRRRWAESTAMLGSGVLGLLDPEIVLSMLGPDAQAFLADRYGLETPRFPRALEWIDPIAWVLACELFARQPDRFHVIEMHPGGGQSDCLSLLERGSRSNGTHIYINMEGSLHGPTDARIFDVWERLAAGDLDAVVRWCEMQWFPNEGTSDPWPHVMARMAARHRGERRWRNGMFDTSGYGGGVRQELFDAMPVVKDACQPRRDDFLENPPNRFWFLVNKQSDDDPIAAVELTTATGWNPAGRAFDLRTEAQSFEASVGERRTRN